MPVLQAELPAQGQPTAQDSTQIVAMFNGEPGLREQRLSSQSEAAVEPALGTGCRGSTTEGSPPEVRPLHRTCSASGLTTGLLDCHEASGMRELCRL